MSDIDLHLLHQLATEQERQKETSFFENKTVEAPSVTNQVQPNQHIRQAEPTPKKNRCRQCNKKLTLVTEFTCKCNHIFCTAHRFADSHNCSFDHKKIWKKELETKNPTIQHDKFEKI